MLPFRALQMRTPTASGGGSNASFTPSASQPASISGSSPYTFTSIDFADGTALVAIGNLNSTSDPSSVTLGGNAMTKVAATTNADRITMWVLSGVTAGTYNVVVTRGAASAGRIMTGTLQNIASATPVSTANLQYSSHTSPHDATSALTVNSGGIGVAYLVLASGTSFGVMRGGLTSVADSPSGQQKLATMTATDTPGFAAGTTVSSAVLAASFDKA